MRTIDLVKQYFVENGCKVTISDEGRRKIYLSDGMNEYLLYESEGRVVSRGKFQCMCEIALHDEFYMATEDHGRDAASSVLGIIREQLKRGVFEYGKGNLPHDVLRKFCILSLQVIYKRNPYIPNRKHSYIDAYDQGYMDCLEDCLKIFGYDFSVNGRGAIEDIYPVAGANERR